MAKNQEDEKAVVGIIMGSETDWPQMKPAADMLEELRIPLEVNVVSAHRTPNWMYEYAQKAAERGLRVLIAGAGGSAHLPGMTAALTTLPVLGVAINSKTFGFEPAVYSCAYMPGGVPLSFMGVDTHGAKNAALQAARILALTNTDVREALIRFQESQAAKVRSHPDPRVSA